MCCLCASVWLPDSLSLKIDSHAHSLILVQVHTPRETECDGKASASLMFGFQRWLVGNASHQTGVVGRPFRHGCCGALPLPRCVLFVACCACPSFCCLMGSVSPLRPMPLVLCQSLSHLSFLSLPLLSLNSVCQVALDQMQLRDTLSYWFTKLQFCGGINSVCAEGPDACLNGCELTFNVFSTYL